MNVRREREEYTLFVVHECGEWKALLNEALLPPRCDLTSLGAWLRISIHGEGLAVQLVEFSHGSCGGT